MGLRVLGFQWSALSVIGLPGASFLLLETFKWKDVCNLSTLSDGSPQIETSNWGSLDGAQRILRWNLSLTFLVACFESRFSLWVQVRSICCGTCISHKIIPARRDREGDRLRPDLGQKIPPQGCSTSLGAIRMGWLFLSWTYTHTSIFWLHKTMFCYGHVWIERLTLRWRPLGSCQTSLVVFHLAPVSIIFLHNIALKGKILLLKMMFVSFCCFTRNSGARGTWNKGVFVGGKT